MLFSIFRPTKEQLEIIKEMRSYVSLPQFKGRTRFSAKKYIFEHSEAVFDKYKEAHNDSNLTDDKPCD